MCCRVCCFINFGDCCLDALGFAMISVLPAVVKLRSAPVSVFCRRVLRQETATAMCPLATVLTDDIVSLYHVALLN